MTENDPYKDSPYDASGMPLSAPTVDYDNVEDVAKATVKDKPVKHPESVYDMDYTTVQIPEEAFEEVDKDKFNTAIRDNVNSAHPPVGEVDTIDFEDVGEKRELLVKEAKDKGFTEVQELPKVEKQETIEEIEKDSK